MPNRSAVWKHLKKEKDDFQCQIWGKIVKNKGWNTSNLMSHLKTIHYRVYSTLQKTKQASSSSPSSSPSHRDLSPSTTNIHDNEDGGCLPRNSTQPSILEAIEKQSPLPSSNKRAKEITDAITHFVAKDSVPVNAVERPGFTHFLHFLEPPYEIPVAILWN